MAATAMSVLGLCGRTIKPALLFDLGGKFDKSFNEASYQGAEKFKTGDGRRIPSSSRSPRARKSASRR
jgi:basic membrane protein A